jgi:hypothetical protein
VTNPPACPAWCELEPGHAFQLLDENYPDIGWYRYHEAAKGDLFGVCQVEEVHNGELLVSAIDVTSALAPDWPGATAAEIVELRRDVTTQLAAVIRALTKAEAGQ